MHMHADPFADGRSRKWYGEILAVGPVPCTDPQAPCLLKTWFDLFFKSLGWTCKFGGSKKGQYLWKW